MSLWWIIVAGLGAIAVALIVVYNITNCYNDFWMVFVAAICITIAVFILAGACYQSACASKEIYLFEEQKAFLESYEPADAVENATITAKITELNGWLYSVQYNVKRWPRWTLYDEMVLDMEPIVRKQSRMPLPKFPKED